MNSWCHKKYVESMIILEITSVSAPQILLRFVETTTLFYILQVETTNIRTMKIGNINS